MRRVGRLPHVLNMSILEITSAGVDFHEEAFSPADPADHTAEGHAIEQELLGKLC